MDTATVSVIVSGVVGIGGLASPLILDLRAGKRRKLEARHERLDELRAVVDDAAVALLKLVDLMPQLEDVQQGREGVAAVIPRLRSGLFVVMQQEARLAARLGIDHPVAKRYKAAQEAFGQVHTHYSRFVGGEDEPGDDVLDGSVRETWAALGLFFEATSKLIGPDRE